MYRYIPQLAPWGAARRHLSSGRRRPVPRPVGAVLAPRPAPGLVVPEGDT